MCVDCHPHAHTKPTQHDPATHGGTRQHSLERALGGDGVYLLVDVDLLLLLRPVAGGRGEGLLVVELGVRLPRVGEGGRGGGGQRYVSSPVQERAGSPRPAVVCAGRGACSRACPQQAAGSLREPRARVRGPPSRAWWSCPRHASMLEKGKALGYACVPAARARDPRHARAGSPSARAARISRGVPSERPRRKQRARGSWGGSHTFLTLANSDFMKRL